VPIPHFRTMPLVITAGSFIAASLLTLTHSPSLAKDKPPPEPPRYAAWKDVDSFTAEGTGTDHWWHYGKKLNEWEDTASTVSVQYRFDLKVSTAVSPRSTTLDWSVQNCQASGQSDYHSRGEEYRHRKSDHWHKGTMNGPTTRGGALRIHLDTGEWDLITESLMAKPFRELGHSHYEHGTYPFDWKIDDGPIDFETANIPGLSIQANLGGATKPGVLTGTTIRKEIKPGPIETGSIRTYRVVMWPNYRDVECSRNPEVQRMAPRRQPRPPQRARRPPQRQSHPPPQGQRPQARDPRQPLPLPAPRDLPRARRRDEHPSARAGRNPAPR
jgi:hypothetical protein